MKLDCRTCTPSQKIERGCEKDSPIPGIWEVEDWRFQRCPLKIVTRQSIKYIEAYNFYEKGFLPCPGGWREQPIKFIQAIGVINKVLAKEDKEKLERFKRSIHRNSNAYK